MPTSYTLSCTKIPCGPHISLERRLQVLQHLKAERKRIDKEEDPDGFDEDSWELGVDVCVVGDGIVLSHDESIQIDTAIWMVEQLVEHFEVNEEIMVMWAEITDKVCPGAFSGGAVLVRRGRPTIGSQTWTPQFLKDTFDCPHDHQELLKAFNTIIQHAPHELYWLVEQRVEIPEALANADVPLTTTTSPGGDKHYMGLLGLINTVLAIVCKQRLVLHTDQPDATKPEFAVVKASLRPCDPLPNS